MVKPLNRTIKNDICFVYRTPASDAEGLKPNEEIRVIEVRDNGSYIVSVDGVRKEIKRIAAKLVMVFE
jgi:hypothetical protein